MTTPLERFRSLAEGATESPWYVTNGAGYRDLDSRCAVMSSTKRVPVEVVHQKSEAEFIVALANARYAILKLWEEMRFDHLDHDEPHFRTQCSGCAALTELEQAFERSEE